MARACAVCGVSTLVPNTEFNFEDDIYCEVSYIGAYTLQECAKQCANGPYVACDRFNGATPLDEVSCYGYSELFEGGCFKQVPDNNYDSWLNCKGNAPGTLLLHPTQPSLTHLDAPRCTFPFRVFCYSHRNGVGWALVRMSRLSSQLVLGRQ